MKVKLLTQYSFSIKKKHFGKKFPHNKSLNWFPWNVGLVPQISRDL